MADIKANLPLGIEPTLVADQAVTVDVAINDFMASLWQAILIILVCSFVSLGVRPGTVVALAIPLTLAIVFAVMDVVNIDLHRISLGALIIALTLLVDDAMTTVDAMINRLAAGDTQGRRGDLRLPDARRADADRHAGHDRELRADRIRAQLGGRVHVLDLRGGRHFADRVLAGGGDLRAAASARRSSSVPKPKAADAEPGKVIARLHGVPARRDAAPVADHRPDRRRLRRGDVRCCGSCRGSSSPPPTGPSCSST